MEHSFVVYIECSKVSTLGKFHTYLVGQMPFGNAYLVGQMPFGNALLSRPNAIWQVGLRWPNLSETIKWATGN